MLSKYFFSWDHQHFSTSTQTVISTEQTNQSEVQTLTYSNKRLPGDTLHDTAQLLSLALAINIQRHYKTLQLTNDLDCFSSEKKVPTYPCWCEAVRANTDPYGTDKLTTKPAACQYSTADRKRCVWIDPKVALSS